MSTLLRPVFEYASSGNFAIPKPACPENPVLLRRGEACKICLGAPRVGEIGDPSLTAVSVAIT